jgi:hypothetical protein
MSARKAYISSLGTTGLLIAAALAMLIVVGALVAFDRWPTQAVAEAESVPITGDAANASNQAGEPRSFTRTGLPARLTAISDKRSRAVLRRAAARAGRVESTVGPAPAVSETIVSDLPAPNTAPSATAPAAPAQQQASAPAPAPAPQTPTLPDKTPPAITLPPGSLAPATEDGVADATTQLGDTLGGLSPSLGETVRGTGTTTTGTIHTLLGGE